MTALIAYTVLVLLPLCLIGLGILWLMAGHHVIAWIQAS